MDLLPFLESWEMDRDESEAGQRDVKAESKEEGQFSKYVTAKS